MIRTGQFVLISTNSLPQKLFLTKAKGLGRSINSLICDGSIISGGLVERSILGPNVKINSFAYVTDSIIMYNCNIGRHARIRRAIIDKNVTIPEGYEIGFDPESDKKKFYRYRIRHCCNWKKRYSSLIIYFNWASSF